MNWPVLLSFTAAALVVVPGATAAADERPTLTPAPTETPVPTAGRVTFEPTAAEDTVPPRYRQTAHEFPFEAELQRDGDSVRVYRVRFPSPVESPVDVNNTVYGHYYQPTGQGPFPGVVMLHILGGEFALSQGIASGLARRGVATLFIKLPYYGERRDPDSPRRLISPNLDETLDAMRQGILDVRRATAWLASRPEVDAKRLGVTGISLGGIVSALAAPAEPRLGSVAIYLGGGNLPAMIWDHAHPELSGLRQRWAAEGLTRESFLKKCAPLDPCTHADRLTGRRVLMVAARHDEIIPPASAVALHKAIGGKAELVWLDAGHHTAALYLFSEMERMARFFRGEKFTE
jgi:dienelactone hydrolase